MLEALSEIILILSLFTFAILVPIMIVALWFGMASFIFSLSIDFRDRISSRKNNKQKDR